MLTSGVYTIENTINGHRYIGGAKRFDSRWYKHQRDLRGKRHHCRHLQHAYNKYGEGAFRFEVLEECEADFLVSMEQWWINMLRPEYNVCPVAGSALGRKHTDEAIARMSAAQKSRSRGPLDEERLRQMHAANKGRRRSAETKCKMSVAQTGLKRRPFSVEAKKNMSEAHVGKHPSAATIAAVVAAHLGKHLTEETRRKIGQASGRARKGKPLSGEHRQAIGSANKGKVRSEETRHNMSEAAMGNKHFLGHHHSEETRHQISVTRKGHVVSEEARGQMRDAKLGKPWSPARRAAYEARRQRESQCETS